MPTLKFPLTHIFKAFQIFLEGEERINQTLTINVNTLKSVKFKPFPSGHWKHEEEIVSMTLRPPHLNSTLR